MMDLSMANVLAVLVAAAIVTVAIALGKNVKLSLRLLGGEASLEITDPRHRSSRRR